MIQLPKFYGFTTAISGMCKNAGKTTMLNTLISNEQDCIALTSIGFDGETCDAVTFTPKPQIYVKKGAIIATAEQTLQYCDITKEILDVFDIYTPLGRIVLVKALSDGYVILAGPSTNSDLMEIKIAIEKFGIKRLLIDGAISRKSLSASSIADSMILCSGAALCPNMDEVCALTAHAVKLYMLNIYQNKSIEGNNSINFSNNSINCDNINIDNNNNILSRVVSGNNVYDDIFLIGAVTDKVVLPMIKNAKNPICFVAEDSSKLMISERVFNYMNSNGNKLCVLQSTKLQLVAINPYSPYGVNFDADTFIKSMRNAIPNEIPIYDAKRKILL
ncbi:MAG: hypothetical protein RR054_04240 [Clostridia bacterium]